MKLEGELRELKGALNHRNDPSRCCSNSKRLRIREILQKLEAAAYYPDESSFYD